MAAASASEPAAGAPRLRAIALRLGRAGLAADVLRGASFQLAAGECVLVQGPTGSGKSTLLRALARLGDVERREGSVETHGRVALLLQHVETQLLCASVGEEIELGLDQLDLGEGEKHRRVLRALAHMRLHLDPDRGVDTLSCGEKQRLVLAALLALAPATLLLDEPCASLDPNARYALADALAALKRAGTALLIAEHAPRELLAVVDRALRIEDGQLVETARPAPARAPAASPTPDRSDLTSLDALRRRERVLLTGPNGAGKSCRLRALARRGASEGRVALAIQEPRRSLFGRTAAEEIGFALERAGAAPADRDARVWELLGRFDLLHVSGRSPRRLSFGQQHRLAIAAAIAARPDFVLLDEPFAGLDPGARRELLRCLEQEQSRTGAALVIASHDRDPLARWCDRSVELPAGGCRAD